MRPIAEPQAGFYRVKLVRGGIHVPVRIWFGCPVIDGEEQDRSPRWCVEVDGQTSRPVADVEGHIEPLDPHEVWPFCEPITEDEYRFMCRRRGWAVDHAPHHPAANPREPIDLAQLPPSW